MSNFAKTAIDNGVAAVVSSLKLERATAGTSLAAPETVANMLGFESLNETAQLAVADTETRCVSMLERSGLRTLLEEKVEKGANHDACVEAGMDAAAMTLMAAADPAGYHSRFVQSSMESAPENTIVLDTGSNGTLSMEGFDDFKFDEFVEASIVTNALSAATNPLAETFFRTVVVPPSRSGIDISVTIPQIYNRQSRKTNGAKYDFAKTGIVRAIVDHTILESNSTKIVAVGSAANAAQLVAAADIANRNVEVGGVTVATRPLKFGVVTDLISVSAHSGIVATGAQNETDSLSPAVALGDVYFKLVEGGATKFIKKSTKGMPGALFTRIAEGKATDMAMNFDGSIIVKSTDLLTDGTTVEAAFTLSTVLGIAAAVPYQIELKVALNGTLQYEHANIRVFANESVIGRVWTGANNVEMPAAQTEYTALVGALANTLEGFEPDAVRSNSNLRDSGTICDSGTAVNYRLPLQMGAPLTSVTPVSVGGHGASLDAMTMIKRVRTSNEAVSKILEFEAQMQNGLGLSENSPAVGGQLVESTYRAKSIDVTAKVVIQRSTGGMDDLRNALTDAVTIMANELILESGYLAALELFTGTTANFEVIVGTDPHIASHLMLSGDGRTIGNDRKFSIASSLDARMKNKIYVSVRRTDVTGADALSYGVLGIMPSLIHQATVSRGGSTAKEVQLIERQVIAVTCPILGRIDVTGMEELFVD